MTDDAAPQDRLTLLVRAISGWSIRHRKAVIVGWLLFVVGCVLAGSLTGTRQLVDAGVGESGRAEQQAKEAGLTPPPSETIMLRSEDPARATAVATTLAARLDRLPIVGTVSEPQLIDGPRGPVILLQAPLRGDPETVGERVGPVTTIVDGARTLDPAVRIDQAGDGSLAAGLETMGDEDLKRVELISLPITLLVLLVAFGALVAASIPMFVGITSVVAALGLVGPLSQLVPTSDATPVLIVLIGLAVGVDYSLFSLRREREERAAGNTLDAALTATTASVGRAVVVAGVTVMVSLAGLMLAGLADFRGMAVGTMVVVAVAVLGSLTVLPALLALLGDRVNRGRLPFAGRAGGGRAGAAWGRIAARSTRRPVLALGLGAVVLVALALPALDMRTADMQTAALPRSIEVVRSYLEIQRAVPGGPSSVDLVVRGRSLDRGALQRLGEQAKAVTDGAGAVSVTVARDARTAVVAVPMPDRSAEQTEQTIASLRAFARSDGDRVTPGATVLVGGWQAGSADFARQMRQATPLVIGFVLGLAFLVLLAAFRSVWLAVSVIALNLASIGAAYGVVTLVFQNTFAEDVLGFISTGTVASWMPLFSFVILFGLSMDYTILVLERMREARLAGLTPREAAAEGVAATAGTVTSAAIVMVAVFSLFAMMRSPDMKQFGFGLAAAIVIDATIVRAMLLPAAVTLLGDRWDPARAKRRPATRGEVVTA